MKFIDLSRRQWVKLLPGVFGRKWAAVTPLRHSVAVRLGLFSGVPVMGTLWRTKMPTPSLCGHGRNDYWRYLHYVVLLGAAGYGWTRFHLPSSVLQITWAWMKIICSSILFSFIRWLCIRYVFALSYPRLLDKPQEACLVIGIMWALSPML